MPTPQRLPYVNGDDGQWGDILVQWLKKEHYDDGTDDPVNGGHQHITLRAGTATAGTAPIQFTSGTLLSTPVAGSMEFVTDSLYHTITTGAVRKTIAMYDDSSGAAGDIYYRASGGAFTRLGIGTTGNVLKVSSGLPSWGTAPSTFADNAFTLQDNVDANKQLQFELSGITTGTTRTITVPDASGTVTLLGNASVGSGSVVLASSPTVTTPILTGLPTGFGVAAAATASTLATRDSNANLTANNFIQSYTTTSGVAMPIVLTAASTEQQFLTGGGGSTVTLPVTSTLALGQEYTIVNNTSSLSTSILSSGGNTILTMAASSSAIFTCILTSGTTAASWSAVYIPPMPSGTIVGTSDTQNLTNKTLTAAALGSSTATTQAAADNSTKLATTAYVDRAAPPGAWTSYTPTLAQGTTSNISKTVNYAKYTQIGKTVIVDVYLTPTASGTASSAISVSLPVTEATSSNLQVGAGYVSFVTGTSSYKAVVVLIAGTTTVQFRRTDDFTSATNIGVSPTTAIPSSGGIIQFNAIYEST